MCLCAHVCLQRFHNAIDACLKMAAKQGIKSIAFPLLGTGVFLNYPDDFVATSMTTLIKRFCQGLTGRCTDIRIVRYRDTEGTVSPCLNTRISLIYVLLEFCVKSLRVTCHRLSLTSLKVSCESLVTSVC
jgi:hypothetical protein